MKLNPDCVRDVLLVLEDNLVLNEKLKYPLIDLGKVYDGLMEKDYTHPEIVYTLQKLIEADYIIATPINANGAIQDIFISSITYNGHQFLENIRDNKVWREVKEKASEVGSFAINFLSQIAINIISSRLG